MIRIRIICDSLAELTAAIEELRQLYGERMSGFARPARAGRRGEYLSYGEIWSKARAKIVLVDPTTGEILSPAADHNQS